MICRLCLKETENVLYFFDEIGAKMDIANVIGKHFWFQPRCDDPISTATCNNCWTKVLNFDDFYKSVKEAEEKFKKKFEIKEEPLNKVVIAEFYKILPTKTELSQFDKVNDREMSINIIDVKEDTENEVKEVDCPSNVVDSFNVLSNQYFLSCDNKPIGHGGTENDQEENTRNYNLQTSTIKEENISSNVQSKTPRKRGRPRKTTVHTEQLKKRNINKVKTKLVRPCNKMKSENEELKKANMSSKVSKDIHARSVESDAEIAKYMSLHCDLCNNEMERFTALKIHMRIKHKVIGYVKCCDKKFLKRQLLLEHIRKHLNPDCYKCDDCNRIFSDKQSMRNHFLVKHQKDEDKIFNCSECSKKFARKYLLEQHKAYAHRDRSTTCKRCNRRFPSIEELNIHNRVRCFGTMCEICARVIRGSTAFQRHQDEHMGIVLPKVQCDECGSWHKDKYALNKHKKRHAQAKESHICGLCQKVTPNRSALLSHISFVHDGRRSYECNVCNKSFKKAIYLREHMAGHTGEVLYRCPHCPKTFNSNANMHSHRKKIHPQEFEELRKLRQQSAHLSVPLMPTIAEMSRKKNVSEIRSNTETHINKHNNNNVILNALGF